jgi:hypothetical protein
MLGIAAHRQQAAMHLGVERLNRPSIISGKPVSSETSRTLSPRLSAPADVPPVETSST